MQILEFILRSLFGAHNNCIHKRVIHHAGEHKCMYCGEDVPEDYYSYSVTVGAV